MRSCILQHALGEGLYFVRDGMPFSLGTGYLVPAIVNLDQLRPGVWVEWESPLLGHCHGHVAMSPEDGWFVVRGHSVTGNLALIHIGWEVRVMPGPPPTENSPPRPPSLELW